MIRLFLVEEIIKSKFFLIQFLLFLAHRSTVGQNFSKQEKSSNFSLNHFNWWIVIKYVKLNSYLVASYSFWPMSWCPVPKPIFWCHYFKFTENKVGTKWYKICTARISMFRIPPGDSCVFIYFHAKQRIFLMQHLFEFKINN